MAYSNAITKSLRKQFPSEYSSFRNMHRRCFEVQNPKYPRYGARGITVCPEWFENFEAFLRDMGAKPTPSHSINRIDNDGPYSPGNCEWATPKQQGQNCPGVHQIEFNGRSQSIEDWAKELGVSSRMLYARVIRRGWDVADALTRPRYTHVPRETVEGRMVRTVGIEPTTPGLWYRCSQPIELCPRSDSHHAHKIFLQIF